MQASRVRWKFEYLAHRAVEALLALLPPAAAYRFGAFLGTMAWHLFPSRRRVVMRNLRIAFAGDSLPGGIESTAREVFRRSGANLLFSLRPGIPGAEESGRLVEFGDLGELRRIVRGGQGLILLTPHMGNWELFTQISLPLPPGVPFGAHYRPLNNPLLDRHIHAQRTRTGLTLFSKNLSPHELSSFIRRPGVLAVLGDQRAGEAGELLPFFGRLTSCSPLAALLARRTGARIAVAWSSTIAPARWQVDFEILPEGAGTAACMAALERAMRSSPADVFWFQDRWKGKRKRPYVTPGRIPRGGLPAFTKPRRGLVWLGSPPDAPPELPFTGPGDVVFEYALPAGSALPAWLAGEKVHFVSARPAGDIRRIDAASDLPLDFVLHDGSCPGLRKASLSQGIPCPALPASPQSA